MWEKSFKNVENYILGCTKSIHESIQGAKITSWIDLVLKKQKKLIVNQFGFKTVLKKNSMLNSFMTQIKDE